MKYYVIYVSNGNLAINEITEFTDFNAARAKYYSVCSLMCADASVNSASVLVLDNQLDVAGDLKTVIVKEQPETKTIKKSSK